MRRTAWLAAWCALLFMACAALRPLPLWAGPAEEFDKHHAAFQELAKDGKNGEYRSSWQALETAFLSIYKQNPRGVVAAFIDPLIEMSLTGEPGWKNYFRLVALVNNTPAWGGETMHRYFDPVVHQFIDTLRKVMPQAQLPDLYWGYQFLTGSMMLALSETGRIDQLSEGLCRSTDLAAVRARLFDYCAAGFEAIVAPRS